MDLLQLINVSCSLIWFVKAFGQVCAPHVTHHYVAWVCWGLRAGTISLLSNYLFKTCKLTF